ncbi:MAG: V-type ATP synthase subunit A [Synergistaceae bacterium]|jgi:V/A-type H+-transporting ATPase subunit A|nr:V-type ATP synthase subunit A [Synergistaceae bacterium]
MEKMPRKGVVVGILGPVLVAEVDFSVRMFEVVRVGERGLLGEVFEVGVRDSGDQGLNVGIQIWEDLTGLSVGEEVLFTGELLSVELGPGFLGEVLDGLGRLYSRKEKLWRFQPSVREGEKISPGDILGTVIERGRFSHRILVPPGALAAESRERDNRVAWIAPEGEYTAQDYICRLENEFSLPLSLTQKWPVRVPRPLKARLPLDYPLFTGQRALDTFLPLALGGTAALTGGSGTGKTLLLRSLAKGCGADVIVYVGCGERGNEIMEILDDFSKAASLRSNGLSSLMDRAIVIAAPSDAPVTLREMAVHLGLTLGEYYRDMGYDAVVMIDSVSRWAEASREIESRVGKTSGEEGYPPWLNARLALCCERAGRVKVLGKSAPGLTNNSSRSGSITLISAISPEGGNLSDPVTQAMARSSGTFWVLNQELAQARRFPAIDWSRSHAFYENVLDEAFAHEASKDWPDLKEYLRTIMKWREELAGALRQGERDALSEENKWLLYHAETLEIVFLRQNAYGETRSSPARMAAMLRFLKTLDGEVRKILKKELVCDVVTALPSRQEMLALRDLPEKDFEKAERKWLVRFTSGLTSSAPTESAPTESAPTESTPTESTPTEEAAP